MGTALWFSPGACSLAPHILLREINADFEPIQFDLKQRPREELRDVNPKMRLPILSVDSEVITETPAILTAISYMSPNNHLLGKTNAKIIRAYEWMNWLSSTLHGQAFASVFQPHRFSNDPSTFEAIKAKGLEDVQRCFDSIEQALSSVYSLDDGFTVIDAYLFVFFRWGVRLGLDMKKSYPKYTSLALAMIERESVQAALKAEGIDAFGGSDFT